MGGQKFIQRIKEKMRHKTGPECQRKVQGPEDLSVGLSIWKEGSRFHKTPSTRSRNILCA